LAKKPKLTVILSALDTLIKPREERFFIHIAQRVEDAVDPGDPDVHIYKKVGTGALDN
jgi:hypothetical protein